MVKNDQTSDKVSGYLIDVDTRLVADGQLAKAVEPRVGALYDPVVMAKLAAAPDTAR